jgi:hypothetical protein
MENNPQMKQNLSKIFLVIFFSLTFFSFGIFAFNAEASNPTQYVNLHDSYTRAPDNVEYYSFTHSQANYHGYISHYRVFIPPGTVALDLQHTAMGSLMGLARHKFPPSGSPSSYSSSSYPTLSELETGERRATFSDSYDLLQMVSDGFTPPLSTNRAGWLYAKVTSDGQYTFFDNHFSVRVDTKTYNTWWDTYIKDQAGWDRYVESVETYIDPTTVNPTSNIPATGPDCASKTCKDVSCDSKNGAANPWIKGTKIIGCATVTASASPNSITPISETPPSEVTYLTWIATDAKKLEVECIGTGTGLVNIPRQDIQLTSTLWEADAKESGLYTKPANAPNGYPGWFHVGTSGTERCTFYPTNQSDGLSGTPFSVEIEVKKLATTSTRASDVFIPNSDPSYICQPDNPGCEKTTCKNVECDDGCGNKIQGLADCDGMK